MRVGHSARVESNAKQTMRVGGLSNVREPEAGDIEVANAVYGEIESREGREFAVFAVVQVATQVVSVDRSYELSRFTTDHRSTHAQTVTGRWLELLLQGEPCLAHERSGAIVIDAYRNAWCRSRSAAESSCTHAFIVTSRALLLSVRTSLVRRAIDFP